MFEFLASFFFTYGVMCSYFDEAGIPNFAHSAFVSLSLFLVMCLSGQLTGGHANPIVTLALLINRGSRITPLIAIAYIVSQFLGSFAGGAVAYAVVANFACAEPNPAYLKSFFNESTYQISTEAQTFGAEIIGSFFFILFLLVIVNETTTFLKSNFWNYLLLPIIFFICREYSHPLYRVTSQIDGLNPAMTLANQVFYGLKYQDNQLIDNSWYPLSVYWAYIIGPLIGTLLASLLFHYLYLPLFIRWKAKK